MPIIIRNVQTDDLGHKGWENDSIDAYKKFATVK